MEHIHRTPGFEAGNWPHEMTLDQNMADLIRHDGDFQTRRGFTYTVLDPDDDVVGCVYIYPLAGDRARGERQLVGDGGTGRPRRAAVPRRASSGWSATGRSRAWSTRAPAVADQSAGLRARLGATRAGSFGIFG